MLDIAPLDLLPEDVGKLQRLRDYFMATGGIRWANPNVSNHDASNLFSTAYGIAASRCRLTKALKDLSKETAGLEESLWKIQDSAVAREAASKLLQVATLLTGEEYLTDPQARDRYEPDDD